MRRTSAPLLCASASLLCASAAVALWTGFASAAEPTTAPTATQAVSLTTKPTTRPTTAPSMRAFDPARHIRTSEVRPGMKGFGLTVLSGTAIGRFDVEVISVLHDMFGPQQDVVMVRCLDPFMDLTGPIAGCSGSPIYLVDDAGKTRLLGAYAYGFDLAKQPIVGVQPIEQMLTLPAATFDQMQRASGVPMSASPMSVSLVDRGWVPKLTRLAKVPAAPDARPRDLAGNTTASGQRLRPLATPLAIRGISQQVLEKLAPSLAAGGFQPMLAMAGKPDASADEAKIEPGSVMAAQMLGGDMELTAIGTCTEVIDGRAYGFGHPFNGEGATSIPMGAGQVYLVMPVLTSSFKIGSMGKASGAIDMDGQYGIAGDIGSVARTIPIKVEIVDAEAGTTRTFNYTAALHRTYTPDLIATAIQSSVLAERSLPLEHTVRFDVSLHFAGERELSMGDVATSLDGFTVIREASVPIVAMMNNPFESVPIESVTARIQILPGVDQLEIEAASPAKPSYTPGETARVHVRLRSATGEPTQQSIEIPLPAVLPEGDHVITLGDAASNLELEAASRPYRFTARSVDELFTALQSITTAGRSDAIYARLANGRVGVSIGRTALPRVPPSRRAILAAAGRPETGATAESDVVIVPMKSAVRGRTDVTIHVKKRLP